MSHHFHINRIGVEHRERISGMQDPALTKEPEKILHLLSTGILADIYVDRPEDSTEKARGLPGFIGHQALDQSNGLPQLQF